MKGLVIFDLDGTLVNAYPAVVSSVNHTLISMGLKPRSSALIKRSVGWGDRHLMAGFTGEDRADEAIRLYRPHHTRALAAAGGVKFIAGSKSLLLRLKKQGYTLAIASNRPTKFTRLILKQLNIADLFKTVLCADKAKQPKPHPDMLWTIMAKHKFSKEQAWYVGDMTIDVQTGQSAGIRTVAVTTGSSTRAQLKALKPYRIISRIGELNSLLTQGAGK